MQFTSKRTIESVAIPGVRFTVRRLGKTQRATRDLATMQERRRSAAVAREWRALLPPMAADGETFANPADDTQESRDKRSALDEEYALLLESVLKPASIRAALISIENLAVDGARIFNAADLLAVENPALDEFSDEVYRACEEAAGLTDEERKNSQPPTTSKEAAPGGINDSTVTPVVA